MALYFLHVKKMGATSRALLKRWGRFWESVSMYLPMILMGLLALGTYWLVRQSPTLLGMPNVRAVKHEVDYFMHQATVRVFDATGQLKSEIYGLDTRHYPDTETLEIDKVRLVSKTAEGNVTVATANRALSNEDASEVQLMGNAVVVRQSMVKPDGTRLPKIEFRGEFLHVFANEQRLKSHLPVELLQDGDRFTADTLVYNHLEQTVDLKGRVKGVLTPRSSLEAAARPGAR